MHKLLLADDSVTIQRVIELTFSGEDIHVVAVNDGEQAIARIPSEQPDIVLADIGMPKKGGYDVAAFVKGRSDLEHIPVLLLAGAFEPVDQARAEQVRCDGVLIKPFEPRQVIERVRELLEGVKGSPDGGRDFSRAEQPTPPAPTPSPVAVAAPADTPVATPAPALDTDAALDEYFESLNAAFESVAPAVPSAVIVDPPAHMPEVPAREVDAPPAVDVQARRRGDSLDDYFDRLSNAFEQPRPADPSHSRPDIFDEPLEERRVPTVDALVATARPSENGAHAHTNGNGAGHAASVNGHERARNPIVDALEAMLGRAGTTPTQPTLPGVPDAHVNGVPVNGAGPDDGDVADTVTERVLERLLPEITATVQRLVREEVDRLKH
jgi:CheY-like chemotaxis protein